MLKDRQDRNKSEVLHLVLNWHAFESKALSTMLEVCQHLRPPLSLDWKLRWRAQSKVFLRLLVALASLAGDGNAALLQVHESRQHPSTKVWLSRFYRWFAILTVCTLSTCVSHLFGFYKYDHLGMSQLGQNILLEALAKKIWIAIQYWLQKEPITLFLFWLIWR